MIGSEDFSKKKTRVSHQSQEKKKISNEKKGLT